MATDLLISHNLFCLLDIVRFYDILLKNFLTLWDFCTCIQHIFIMLTSHSFQIQVLSQIYVLFFSFKVPYWFYCVAQTLKGEGTPTEAWQTYLTLHPEKKTNSPHPAATTVSRSSARQRHPRAPQAPQTGLTQVLYRYSFHEICKHHGSVMPRRHNFLFILPNIWLFKSFWHLFWDGAWALGREGDTPRFIKIYTNFKFEINLLKSSHNFQIWIFDFHHTFKENTFISF